MRTDDLCFFIRWPKEQMVALRIGGR